MKDLIIKCDSVSSIGSGEHRAPELEVGLSLCDTDGILSQFDDEELFEWLEVKDFNFGYHGLFKEGDL